MILGLKKGAVKLVPHNKKWASLFEKEKRLLQKSFGDAIIKIEHVGSTSIKDICAKPILDIDVGVKSVKYFEKVARILEKLGYTNIKNKNSPHVHLVFAKGNKRIGTTHYVHVIKHNGILWKNDIRFRDYLRTHKKVAQQYAKLKKKLALTHQNDRMAYTVNKASFIKKFSKK